MEEEQSYAQAVSPNIIVHSAIVMPYFYNYGTPEQGSILFRVELGIFCESSLLRDAAFRNWDVEGCLLSTSYLF